MVIGSGPIVIGQAAEFDYSGSQACQSLREEGVRTVLVNSNPATIQTDPDMADAVYVEPLTVEFLEKIIAKEKPDGILSGLGGQTGLNLSSELAEHGVLEKHGVELLGTVLSAIQAGEDREKFRELMLAIQEPIPRSHSASSVDEAKAIARDLGYPVIVRAAYTLGGTGSGVAHDEEELDPVLLEDPVLRELAAQVQPRLPAEAGEDAVRPLLRDDLLQELDGEGFHVHRVRHVRVRLDRGGVRVHEDRADALLAE